MKIDKYETNSHIDRLTRRNKLMPGKCSRCPLHDGENRGRRVRPDKYKNKKRK